MWMSAGRDLETFSFSSDNTSSMTISAALRTDSMTSPRALHTPTCPGVSPLSRAHGAAPDTGLERGSLARELGYKRQRQQDSESEQIQKGKLIGDKKRERERGCGMHNEENNT